MSEPDSPRSSWLHDAFEQYEGQLVRYATRLLGDADRGQDVAQDAFLRLCRQERAKVDGNVRQWLFAVCRNRALDVQKKETRMKALSDTKAEACEGRERDPTAVLEAHETAGVATAILATLPDNQRQRNRPRPAAGQQPGLSAGRVGIDESAEQAAAVKARHEVAGRPVVGKRPRGDRRLRRGRRAGARFDHGRSEANDRRR